jgi:hypothetical protein
MTDLKQVWRLICVAEFVASCKEKWGGGPRFCLQVPVKIAKIKRGTNADKRSVSFRCVCGVGGELIFNKVIRDVFLPSNNLASS